MVQSQLHQRGIRDRRVLEAFRTVPRHRFVSAELQSQAYEDQPLPIGSGQTISQPYVVAYMLQALQLRSADRVMELGAGCGYLTALLAHLVADVHAIELLPELAAQANATLRELGCERVRVVKGNGLSGAPERAPFDAIIGSAAAPDVPENLLQQLVPGGRMILPVGNLRQHLVLVVRSPSGPRRRTLLPVRFVPMISR